MTAPGSDGNFVFSSSIFFFSHCLPLMTSSCHARHVGRLVLSRSWRRQIRQHLGVSTKHWHWHPLAFLSSLWRDASSLRPPHSCCPIMPTGKLSSFLIRQRHDSLDHSQREDFAQTVLGSGTEAGMLQTMPPPITPTSAGHADEARADRNNGTLPCAPAKATPHDVRLLMNPTLTA